jgi:hypothetical protein
MVTLLGSAGDALARRPRPAYAPLAIFDMDGEGAPEVIYRWSSGADSGLGVLEFDPITEQLHLVTTSAYGTTA